MFFFKLKCCCDISHYEFLSGVYNHLSQTSVSFFSLLWKQRSLLTEKWGIYFLFKSAFTVPQEVYSSDETRDGQWSSNRVCEHITSVWSYSHYMRRSLTMASGRSWKNKTNPEIMLNSRSFKTKISFTVVVLCCSFPHCKDTDVAPIIRQTVNNLKHESLNNQIKSSLVRFSTSQL